MALQSPPRSAEQNAAVRRDETGAAVSAVLRQWRRIPRAADVDLDAEFARILPGVLTVLDVAQERVAQASVAYVPRVLEETGQRVREPAYEVEPWRLVGTAGDGRGTDSLAYEAVVATRTALGRDASMAQALAFGSRFLSTATGTLLSDTARTAEKSSAHARGVGGWVRMLQTPSCGRCVILAGKWYRTNVGFDRHPGCDCTHIPAAESIAGDLTVDPTSYLNSLDEAGLRKALGSRANAQAYLDGASPNQLINAYRKSGGVRSAQVYNQRVKYTTEGVTRRGQAYRSMRDAGYAGPRTDFRNRGDRYLQARAPRLMPESIYKIATDREDAIRLLRLYGWA